MRRGAFESVQLSQTADSAKEPNIQLQSLARGLMAMSDGMKSVSDCMDGLADLADKAYGEKQNNLKRFNEANNSLAIGKARLAEVNDVYKGRETTQEGAAAIKAAQMNVDTLQQQRDLALDRYKRTGWLFPKLGTATAESGRKRMEDAGGDYRKAPEQSLLGAMFYKLW